MVNEKLLNTKFERDSCYCQQTSPQRYPVSFWFFTENCFNQLGLEAESVILTILQSYNFN